QCGNRESTPNPSSHHHSYRQTVPENQKKTHREITQGQLGRPRRIDHLPNGLNLADQPVAFADMDGTGTADVLMLAESPLGYLRNEAGQGWSSRRQPFTQAPTFDVSDNNVRLVDLNGDGRVDVIRSSEHYFYVYLNQQEGWSEPVPVPRIHDLAQFPDVFNFPMCFFLILGYSLPI
ncbi:MAG: VCBS repeat-containing protein, partial [Exilibacterium sp.]